MSGRDGNRAAGGRRDQQECPEEGAGDAEEGYPRAAARALRRARGREPSAIWPKQVEKGDPRERGTSASESRSRHRRPPNCGGGLPQALSTSTTARAALSPVRRRKMSSSPSSPAAACARSSAIVPEARIFPP